MQQHDKRIINSVHAVAVGEKEDWYCVHDILLYDSPRDLTEAAGEPVRPRGFYRTACP